MPRSGTAAKQLTYVRAVVLVMYTAIDAGRHHVQLRPAGHGGGRVRQLQREGGSHGHRDEVQMEVEDVLAAVGTVR